jgi:PAS domain S-box-containing protein
MKKNEYSGSLPRNTLDLISPFHFTFDRDLKIISAGKGIEKIAPNIVGSDFSKLFQFKRPFSTLYEFDSIIKYTKQIFLLDSVDSELILRGQIIHVEQSEELIFIGSPWITRVNDLEKYGLLITDFALNDTTPDLLHVFQAQEIAIKEIKQLVKNLDKQKLELNQSRKLYKQLVEEAGDIIFRTDSQGLISYINPMGLHVFNQKEEDIVGTHFTELIVQNYRAEALSLFKDQVSAKDFTCYQEFPYRIGKGENPWYGQNIILLIEDDQLIGAQVVARDITERKKFEAELLKAKEIAEESELAKEKFLANMSHEIRTPMNAIYGLANILMDKNLSNEDRESVRAINHSAKNLIRIINDILDFSKIESGNVEIRQTSFDLEQVLDGVSQTLRLVALNKNIELRTLVDSNVPKELLGDPIRLRQILLNLESNAIKFTEQGHVETHVKLKHKSDEECILIFEVKDTGIGIPESKLQTIFRSFTQASDDTSRKYGGTGLGLTIAKELIELQSGTIDVHSIQGHGSTFVFTLKFELGKGLEPKAKLEERNYSLDELSGYKFLMAEDNPMNQLLAKKVFAKWNCKIDFADNGQIAIDKLNVNDYDLILMDLQMPELDGYQTTKYIRNEMRQPKSEIPIIAITAHALSGESARCISIGMNDYISKPFDQLDLFEKILTIVQKSTV